MPHDVEDLRGVPLDELAQNGEPVPQYYRVSLEFQYRQTKAQYRQTRAQIEAAEAAKRAAEAAVSSAEYAKKSVRWMFWSVVVLALASVASFVLDLIPFLWRLLLRLGWT
jgi:hypothetical protein